MIYLAFIFALALACVAGMEFICLVGLETKNRQLKRRLSELERERFATQKELYAAQEQLAELKAIEEESWPELIDDNSFR